MGLRPLAAVVGVLRLAATAGAAQAGGLDDPRLEGAGSWAFAIGDGMLRGEREAVGDRLGEFDLVVVDGELVRPGEVEELKARGAAVLAYLSVGTIEKWRR
jgi:hypothetical protein